MNVDQNQDFSTLKKYQYDCQLCVFMKEEISEFQSDFQYGEYSAYTK